MLYVCYSINDFSVMEAGISMLSFLMNNPGYEPEELFFIDYGIAPAHKDVLNGILAEAAGKSPDAVVQDTDRDHFMSAEEAKAWGIVDNVL